MEVKLRCQMSIGMFFRLHNGEMVSGDINNSERMINNVQSSLVVVPRTTASSETLNGSRSKVTVYLQSSTEKVNTFNDLDSTLNQSHDVIKCPLSSLQKALKSSVDGEEFLHSLRCTEKTARTKTKSLVSSNLEISAEKKFVANDGSVKIIKILSPIKCNKNAWLSKVATDKSRNEKSSANKLTNEVKLSSEETEDEICRISSESQEYHHQLKSTEELLSSPEDGSGSLQTRKQSFASCGQNSDNCGQKSSSTDNSQESRPEVSTPVETRNPTKTLPSPRNCGQSIDAFTNPKSAIQSTSSHCDHNYSPVKRITSPPKVNILKRNCNVNRRSALVDFLETVKQGNLTPPTKIQRFSRNDDVVVRKELVLRSPRSAFVFENEFSTIYSNFKSNYLHVFKQWFSFKKRKVENVIPQNNTSNKNSRIY